MSSVTVLSGMSKSSNSITLPYGKSTPFSTELLSGRGLYMAGSRNLGSVRGLGLTMAGGGLTLPGQRGGAIGKNLGSIKAALKNVSGVVKGLESLQQVQRADMATQRANNALLPTMTENPLMGSVKGRGIKTMRR